MTLWPHVSLCFTGTKLSATFSVRGDANTNQHPDLHLRLEPQCEFLPARESHSPRNAAVRVDGVIIVHVFVYLLSVVIATGDVLIPRSSVFLLHNNTSHWRGFTAQPEENNVNHFDI